MLKTYYLKIITVILWKILKKILINNILTIYNSTFDIMKAVL
jgi:hypothetical protein